jgi:hypothetical protein
MFLVCKVHCFSIGLVLDQISNTIVNVSNEEHKVVIIALIISSAFN